MNQSVWQRASMVLQRSRINQAPSQVTLDIKTIKIALGVSLIQSIVIAGVLAFTYHSPDAWFYPFYTLLQIGWIWDKITSNSFDYSRVNEVPENRQNNLRNFVNEETENLAPSVFHNPMSDNNQSNSLFGDVEEHSIIKESNV